MKTEQLSPKDQKRVSDALSKCASETKSIEDPQQLEDAAYGIFKESLGDNPKLFKVACRVYNSCKSIHKLAAADDDTRGDTFALLDANAMAERLKNDNRIAMCKQASAPATFGVLPTIANTVEEPIRKVASAVSKITGIVPEKMSGAEKREAIVRIVGDWESMVKEASAELTMARREFSDAMDVFVATFGTIPTALRKSAAAKVYANYGKFAADAIDRFNEARPMYKVASSDYVDKYKGTPIIDDPEVAEAVDKLDKANDKLLAKKAYLDRVVVECATAVDELFEGVKKSASVGDTAIKSVITADLASGIPSLLGYDYTDEYAKSQLANIELENAILAAGSRRAFIKSLHNDTIASYPLPKIVEAFNMAYSKLPPSVRRMPATRSQAMINAEMITTLAENNTPSKADREHLLSIMKQFDTNAPVAMVEGLVSR